MDFPAEQPQRAEDLLQENRALRDVLRHTSLLLEQRSREFGLFRMVSDTVNRVVSEPNALRLILEQVRELIGAENGSIMLFDQNVHQLSISAATGTKDGSPTTPHVAPGDGIAGWVYEHREPLFIRDVREEPRFAEFDPRDAIRSLICLPITFEGDVIGVLNLSHSERGAFSRDAIRTLEIILPQVAIAIHNIHSLSRHQDRTETLRRKNRELEEANRRLAETQRELVKVERLKAISELSISMNHEINNPLAAIVGDVQFLLGNDKSDDPVVRYHLEDVQKQCYRVSDILQKLRTMEEAVTTDYADGLRMIDLERSSAQLPLFDRVQDSYYSILRESLTRWEENARYWRGHSAKVSELAVQIGKELSLPGNEIQILKRMGSVWNVGVLTVDEQILLKAENLAPSEVLQIEERRKASHALLDPLRFSLYSDREDVGGLHERNSAYVLTPLHEAILNVANAFVALVSDRPHRSSYRSEEAVRVMHADLTETPYNIEALVALRRALGIELADYGQASA